MRPSGKERAPEIQNNEPSFVVKDVGVLRSQPKNVLSKVCNSKC